MRRWRIGIRMERVGIRDPLALGRAITGIAGLSLGGWLLSRAATGPDAAFPVAAFALITLSLVITGWPPRANGTKVSRVLDLALSWRALALLGAVWLSGWQLSELPRRSLYDSHTDLVLAWLLALVFYWLAAVPPPRRGEWRRRRVVRWCRWPFPALPLTAIVLTGLGLRLWQLGTIPFVLGGDEAVFGSAARQIIDGTARDPFALGVLSQPMMSWYLGGLGMRWLGPEVAALRLPWALIGTASVLTTYWLLSLLHGRRLALLTAAFLATYHFHIHYSRIALNNIGDPLIVGLVLIFLLRALRGDRASDWFGSGVCCGLALYLWTGARFAPVLVSALLLYRLVRGRGRFLRRYGGGCLVALGAFALTAAPMLQVALRSPRDFFARTDEIGIFQSGWLIGEAHARGTHPVLVLLDHARHALLAFNLYPDTASFYNLPTPLLDPVSGVLFLFGLGYATVQALRPGPYRRFAPLVAWWWGGMILGGVLTIGAPSSQRLITLAVPVCFFIALALQRLASLLRAAIPAVPRHGLLLAAVLAFTFVSVKTYFVDYTPLRRYGGAHAQIATVAAPRVAGLGPRYDAYLAGAPAMFWSLPTFGFLAPGTAGHDLVEPLTAATVPVVPPGRGAVFIFTAARVGELALVRAAYPDGTEEVIDAPPDGRALAHLYVVRASGSIGDGNRVRDGPPSRKWPPRRSR